MEFMIFTEMVYMYLGLRLIVTDKDRLKKNQRQIRHDLMSDRPHLFQVCIDTGRQHFMSHNISRCITGPLLAVSKNHYILSNIKNVLDHAKKCHKSAAEKLVNLKKKKKTAACDSHQQFSATVISYPSLAGQPNYDKTDLTTFSWDGWMVEFHGTFALIRPNRQAGPR